MKLSEKKQQCNVALKIIDSLLDQSSEIKVLSQCQVALITATSIINHTMDTLLDKAEYCRKVVVLGASTPMLPEAFLETNVSMLSGVVAEEPMEVLRVVSEGGGMRLFKPYVRKVNLIL